jgi:hypothetical protein
MGVNVVGDRVARRVRGDVGATITAVAAAIVVISLFLPWYVVTFVNGAHTGTISVSAISAGGGRFFVLGLAVAAAVAALLGPRVRALAVCFALVLLYATWICQANSPPIETAGIGSGIITGSGAHLGVVATYAVVVGAAIHMAKPGAARTAGHVNSSDDLG